MTTIRTPFFFALALAATVQLSGCASKDEDSPTLTQRWTQGWKKMREHQDAQAREWVATDPHTLDPSEQPGLDGLPTSRNPNPR